MAKSFLKRVAKEKHHEIDKTKKKVSFEKILEKMLALPPVRNFREAIFNSPHVGIIGEIKRKAPGKISWNPHFNLEKLVKAYEEGGALGISVVTDTKYFGGSLNLIAEVKKATGLPVLCKDFIVDTYQIYEARAARVDALLLIAEIIPDKMLARFIELTGSLGMTPVVEVHTIPDLKRSLRAGADVILINNRDLNTLKVNMQTINRMARLVPKDHIVIAASGYETVEDINKIESDRVRAILIGRALLSSKEPERMIRNILEELDKA